MIKNNKEWRSTVISDGRYEIIAGDKIIATVYNAEDAELVAKAQRLNAEVERLNNGIDYVLFSLANEDISDVKVVEEIANELRMVYNGKNPESFNPFYKGGE